MKQKKTFWIRNLILFLFLISLILGAVRQQPVLAGELMPPVRVGVFPMNHFFEQAEDGTLTGYGIDYLNRLADYTGWTYEYIMAESWDECIELLRENQVDLIAPAEKDAERLREFAFSSFSIGMECGGLLALSTNEKLIYEDFEAFQNLKIGCVDTLIFKNSLEQYAKINHFSPDFVSYKNTSALLAALNAGEIDVILANLFVKTDTMKVLAKFGAAPFYFMLNKENYSLQTQLNSALQQLKTEDISFETLLMEQYYPAFYHIPYTKAELEYIASAPVLTVACRSNIQPLSYLNKTTGEVEGITRDILDAVSRYSGLTFEYVMLPEGSITYDYLREHKISLISSVEYNQENMDASGLHLTNPYLDSKKVFVCNKDAYFDSGDTLRLAVATGSQTLAQVIHDTYPNFQIDIYQTVQECFEAVRSGNADILLQNQYVVTNYLAKPIYSEMITVPVEGLEDKMSLSPVVYQEKGILDSFLSDDRLISILNKAIRQLDQQEITKIIIKQTTENPYQYTIKDFFYQYRYSILALAFILFILAIISTYAILVKKKSYQAIQRNESKLRHITNNINGGVVVLTGKDELRINYANEGFLDLLHIEKENYEDQIRNQNYITYLHPDDVRILQCIYTMDLQQKNKISVKLRIMRKDGKYIPVLFNGTLTENAKGERKIYCVIMNISEQERLMEKISLEQEKYRILVENSGEIIFQIDCRENNILLSPLYEEKFGWKLWKNPYPGEASALPILLKVHDDDQETVEHLIHQAGGNQETSETTARLMKPDGSYLWCRIALYPMADKEGHSAYMIGKILDVDNDIRAREELEQRSKTDALTGLLNKNAFFQEASEYLASARGKNTTLVFIDIDNFKQVNDKLGHIMGDQAIKETAKKLRIIFSNYDILSRFGGDEFCILLKELPEETLKDKLAWAVEKLRTVYSLDGEDVHCSASIGAACTYGRKIELKQLLEQADSALYQAKDQGKDQFILYSNQL